MASIDSNRSGSVDYGELECWLIDSAEVQSKLVAGLEHLACHGASGASSVAAAAAAAVSGAAAREEAYHRAAEMAVDLAFKATFSIDSQSRSRSRAAQSKSRYSTHIHYVLSLYRAPVDT